MTYGGSISKHELKRAPHRSKWANYGRNIKITVIINVVIYTSISTFSYISYMSSEYRYTINPITMIFNSILASVILGGFLFGWNITAFTVIYIIYAYYKIKPTKLALLAGLIENNQILDLADLSRETGIQLYDVRALTKELIDKGILQGTVRDGAFVPTGQDMSTIITKGISDREINQLKGMLKIKGKTTLQEIAELFSASEGDIRKVLYEIVGSGKVNLVIKEGIVSIPEGQDVDEVMDKLDAAFREWEAKSSQKRGKI